MSGFDSESCALEMPWKWDQILRKKKEKTNLCLSETVWISTSPMTQMEKHWHSGPRPSLRALALPLLNPQLHPSLCTTHCSFMRSKAAAARGQWASCRHGGLHQRAENSRMGPRFFFLRHSGCYQKGMLLGGCFCKLEWHFTWRLSIWVLATNSC